MLILLIVIYLNNIVWHSKQEQWNLSASVTSIASKDKIFNSEYILILKRIFASPTGSRTNTCNNSHRWSNVLQLIFFIFTDTPLLNKTNINQLFFFSVQDMIVLSPPATEKDYFFNLNDEEGLCDLFDLPSIQEPLTLLN